MTIELKEGRSYYDRIGKVHGPVRKLFDGSDYDFVDPISGIRFHSDGACHIYKTPRLNDLVEEVSSPNLLPDPINCRCTHPAGGSDQYIQQGRAEQLARRAHDLGVDIEDHSFSVPKRPKCVTCQKVGTFVVLMSLILLANWFGWLDWTARIPGLGPLSGPMLVATAFALWIYEEPK